MHVKVFILIAIKMLRFIIFFIRYMYSQCDSEMSCIHQSVKQEFRPLVAMSVQSPCMVQIYPSFCSLLTGLLMLIWPGQGLSGIWNIEHICVNWHWHSVYDMFISLHELILFWLNQPIQVLSTFHMCIAVNKHQQITWS